MVTKTRFALALGASFGGAFGATGVIGLVSQGPVHHPAADTLFAVVGIAVALSTMALALRAQRRDRHSPVRS